MAYIGHEPQRHTIKVSLPGTARRLALSARCSLQCGQVVRQDGSRGPDDRPAAFSAHSPGDEEVRAMYKGRTAVERVNARLKIFWGADDGNLVGARRFPCEWSGW